jgi:hypothetical protein
VKSGKKQVTAEQKKELIKRLVKLSRENCERLELGEIQDRIMVLNSVYVEMQEAVALLMANKAQVDTFLAIMGRYPNLSRDTKEDMALLLCHQNSKEIKEFMRELLQVFPGSQSKEIACQADILTKKIQDSELPGWFEAIKKPNVIKKYLGKD